MRTISQYRGYCRMSTAPALFVLIAFLFLGLKQQARAQSITFQNQNGQQVSSWKDGDRITVVVQGGGSNVHWVDIVRQSGYPV